MAGPPNRAPAFYTIFAHYCTPICSRLVSRRNRRKALLEARLDGWGTVRNRYRKGRVRPIRRVPTGTQQSRVKRFSAGGSRCRAPHTLRARWLSWRRDRSRSAGRSTRCSLSRAHACEAQARRPRSARDFSDGCYKKFVLDGANWRIYRRRIDFGWRTLRGVVGATSECPSRRS